MDMERIGFVDQGYRTPQMRTISNALRMIIAAYDDDDLVKTRGDAISMSSRFPGTIGLENDRI